MNRTARAINWTCQQSQSKLQPKLPRPRLSDSRRVREMSCRLSSIINQKLNNPSNPAFPPTSQKLIKIMILQLFIPCRHLSQIHPNIDEVIEFPIGGKYWGVLYRRSFFEVASPFQNHGHQITPPFHRVTNRNRNTHTEQSRRRRGERHNVNIPPTLKLNQTTPTMAGFQAPSSVERAPKGAKRSHTHYPYRAIHRTSLLSSDWDRSMHQRLQRPGPKPNSTSDLHAAYHDESCPF